MKRKGIFQLVAIVLAIVLVGYIAIAGIGSKKYGSVHDISLGLDLAGGVSITYQAVDPDVSSESMKDATYKLLLRAQDRSTESAVYQEGSDRINVDIPNVTDANTILEDMGRVGNIYFIYAQGSDGVANIVFNSQTGKYDTLTRSMEEIIASGNMVMDGGDIANAQPYIYNNGIETDNLVILTLNEGGSSKFEQATRTASQYANSGRDLRNIIAIVYDGVVVCAPGVPSVITGTTAQIEGQESFESASALASTIRIGALPVELEEIRSQIVGARLGAEAIDTSLIAGLIGLILVMLFMIVMYRVPGLSASLALLIYVGLMVVGLNIFKVTLTLPGIAGIILSIGMAVDANVIIFARIREEMATGKTMRSCIKLGFKKARSAILDGNITTLIAAVVLYLRGSGSVRGFALTLGIGIILSMITALFITNFILNGFFNLGLQSEACFGTMKQRKPMTFVKHASKFACISGALIIIGVIALVVNKSSKGTIFNYGLDFAGGTSTEVTFPGELPANIQSEIETIVHDTTGVNAEISLVPATNGVIIKTTTLGQEDRINISDRLVQDYGVDPELITTSNISGAVSNEMRKDALWAVIIATACMLVYIWIRFKNVKFALSAVLALLHDVVIVMVLYAVASKFIPLGSTFIACILTIVGYSINATIVVFDRIRENMAAKLKKESVADVVDSSITSTLSRSINTSVTTLFMVLTLAIFGMDSVREFAIPLIVGIIAGGFSSICLTGPLWHFMQRKGSYAAAVKTEE